MTYLARTKLFWKWRKNWKIQFFYDATVSIMLLINLWENFVTRKEESYVVKPTGSNVKKTCFATFKKNEKASGDLEEFYITSSWNCSMDWP